MPEIISLDRLPAKTQPFQSIRTHSLVTGIVAQELFSAYLSGGTCARLSSALGMNSSEANEFVGYFASLHDIGKLGTNFISKMLDELDADLVDDLYVNKLITFDPKKGIRHELTGQRILQELWIAEGDLPSRSRDLLTSIIGAHHQGAESHKHEYAHGSPWRAYWTMHEQEMSDFFLSKPFKVPVVSENDRAFLGAVLNGVVIMSDWIASGEAFSDAQGVLSMPEGTDLIKSRAARFMTDSQLSAPPWKPGETFEEVFGNLVGPARPLQKLTEQILCEDKERASLLLIEAPMGEGKTEAALYAAAQMARQWGKNGIYFALPTAATANQMVGRVRAFLEQAKVDTDVRLLHGMAWLSDETRQSIDFAVDEDAVKAAAAWLKPVRRGLLGNWAVGTVDQAMMAAMFIKYGVLRLLGLSGKVLVIDELHSYDVYMSDILKTLLQWAKALEVPVVLLSATLPLEKKSELLDAYGAVKLESIYPGITCARESGAVEVRRIGETIPRKPVSVQVHENLHQANAIAELAIDLAQDGGVVGVLVNTVDDAQTIYERIAAQGMDAIDTHLFHSRFLADRRKVVENRCVEVFGPRKKKRTRGAVLVCTQVAEQSIDIDLDALITAAAPMDLLLQRLGRMHRHNKTKRSERLTEPVLHVLVPENADWAADGCVYPTCLLNQTRRLLEKTNQISLPEDIPTLVEAGYDTSLAPEEMEAWFEQACAQDMQRAQSHVVQLEPPDQGFEPLSQNPVFDDLEDRGYLSAKTRLSSPSVRIALLEPDLYRKAEQRKNGKNEVKVFERDLAKLIMSKSVSVPASKLKRAQAPLRGAGLLQNVDIYPVVDGKYEGSDGVVIINDDDLGVRIEC